MATFNNIAIDHVLATYIAQEIKFRTFITERPFIPKTDEDFWEIARSEAWLIADELRLTKKAVKDYDFWLACTEKPIAIRRVKRIYKALYEV